MKGTPAFQFYARDFVSDSNVLRMTLEERGTYITLLCFQWMDGGIPDDATALAALCGCDSGRMATLWTTLRPRFSQVLAGTGLLANPRLEKERRKQEAYRLAQSRAAKIGATKRWGQNAPAMRPAKPNDSSASSLCSLQSAFSSASEDKEKPPLPPEGGDGGGSAIKPRKVKLTKDSDYSPEFLEFWSVYPKTRKGSKPEAAAFHAGLLLAGVPAADLLRAAQNYKRHLEATGKTGFTMEARRFLGRSEEWRGYENWAEIQKEQNRGAKQPAQGNRGTAGGSSPSAGGAAAYRGLGGKDYYADDPRFAKPLSGGERATGGNGNDAAALPTAVAGDGESGGAG